MLSTQVMTYIQVLMSQFEYYWISTHDIFSLIFISNNNNICILIFLIYYFELFENYIEYFQDKNID